MKTQFRHDLGAAYGNVKNQCHPTLRNYDKREQVKVCSRVNCVSIEEGCWSESQGRAGSMMNIKR